MGRPVRDFLVTKHGLAEALHSDQAGFERLHAEFVGRLLPVLEKLLQASAGSGHTRSDIKSFDLMLGVGNLCIGTGTYPDYDARRMIDLLLAGLAVAPPNPIGLHSGSATAAIPDASDTKD